MIKKPVVIFILFCTSGFLILSCNTRNNSFPAITPTYTETFLQQSFSPLLRGTSIPSVLEKIKVENAESITLLSSWNTLFIPYEPSIAFTDDGKALLIEYKFFRVEDGSPIEKADIKSNSHKNTLQSKSLDGRFSAKIDGSGDLEIVNLNKPSTMLYYYLDEATSVLFFPDNKHLIVTFNDGQIWFVAISSWESRLLDLENDHADFEMDLRPELAIDVGESQIEDIYLSPDLSLMAFFLKNNQVQIWDTTTLTHIQTINYSSKPTHLVIAPDNNYAAISSNDNRLRIWDILTGQMLRSLEGHTKSIDGVAISPDGRILASLEDNWVYLWAVIPSPDLIATSTEKASTPVFNQAALPKPSPTPTSSLPIYNNILPLGWSSLAPTNKQITDAINCPIESLVISRYPEHLAYWQLETSYDAKTACDWAVLAFAYQQRKENADLVSEEGKRAFTQAFIQNPAFAFTTPLFYSYFDSIDLVSPPPFATQTVRTININYSWSGIGEPSKIEYKIGIKRTEDLSGKFIVSAKVTPAELAGKLNKNLDTSLVESIGPSLTNLLPIETPVEFEQCTDNSPNWSADLTFADGTKIFLSTNHSNMFTAGGPWQVLINDKLYLQYSSELFQWFMDIFQELGLPLGQPMGMYCQNVDVFNLIYQQTK